VRFGQEYGLSESEARQLVATRALADFFEAAQAAAGGSHESARSVANWLLRDLAAVLKEQEREIEDVALDGASLGRLVALVEEGRVTPRSARELLPELVESGGDPVALVRERGLEAVSDQGLLEVIADEVIAANPEAAETVASGDAKAVNFLMGQVMKKTQGKADPATVRALLLAKLEG
jgi:aspartyl-tRNA(Asn)/glutamyl-tRNA(Gln) amidotransferase subunit B